MTAPSMKRYARQMRLVDLGAAAQEKWQAARVVVRGSSLAARTEALYLAGAGIGTLVVAEDVANAVRALNPDVVIEPERPGDAADGRTSNAFELVDPSCAAVAAGALAALRELKAALAAS